MMKLAWQSLKARRSTALLTIFSLTLAIVLLLGVDRLRHQIKYGFENALSGTDLIVGGRTGQLNLLLYSVFRIGNATNNIDWKTFEMLEDHASVNWAVPISLGDSHQGFRVLGTDNRYFEHYQYGRAQPLRLAQGHDFQALGDVVLGSQVANKLNYGLGQSLLIAHGLVDTNFSRHKNVTFTVAGILAPTGTPVDNTVHVTLGGLEAVHAAWNQNITADSKPQQITAILLGLKSKLKLFGLQRHLNTYPIEPLSAILPAMALKDLWQLLSNAERTLLVISAFVLVMGFLGMLSTLLLAQRERRREMAILRVIGARPKQILFLLTLESAVLTFISLVLGVITLQLLWLGIAPLALTHYGIDLGSVGLSLNEWQVLFLVQGIGTVIGLLPALLAYRRSLHDGITLRI